MTVLPNRQKQSSSHAGHWAELDTFQVFLPQGISGVGRQKGIQRCASQVALVVKNLPADAGDIRDAGLILGLGRSPGRGHGNLFQYSCLKNSIDSGAHGVPESRTRLKQLSTAHKHGCFGLGCYSKTPHMGWLVNNRNLFSYSSGGWKSKSRGPAWQASGEKLLPGCRPLTSSYVLTWWVG